MVLSNDTVNALLNRVQIVPTSSQVERLCRAETYLSLNGGQRKAVADQIITASKHRLQRRLSVLSKDDLIAVGRIVRLQIDL